MQNVKRNRIWSSASSEPFPSPAPSLGPKRYGKAWGDDRSPKRPRRSTGADWPAQEWASESMGMNLDEASTLVTPRSSSPSSSTPSHSLSDGLTELHSLADAALGSALTSPEQDGTTPMDWVVTHHRGIENGDARTICYGAVRSRLWLDHPVQQRDNECADINQFTLDMRSQSPFPTPKRNDPPFVPGDELFLAPRCPFRVPLCSMHQSQQDRRPSRLAHQPGPR